MSGDNLDININHLTAIQRETLRRLATSEINILDAIAKIDAALKAESSANSLSARASAQRAVMAARDNVLDALGVTDLEKRRLYITAMGMAEGAPCRADEFNDMLATSDGGKNVAYLSRLRMSFARFVLDNGRLFGDFAGGLVAEDFLAHNRGHNGPLDHVLPPEIEAVVNEVLLGAGGRERLSGVEPGGARYDAVLRELGLEMGGDARRLYGAKGNIDPEFWTAWARHFNQVCAEHKIPARRGKGYYRLSAGKLRTASIQHPVLSEAFNAGRAEKAAPAATVPT